MGEALDTLELKLARVWVPPHTRTGTHGNIIHVNGYWRRISDPPGPSGDCYMSAINFMWDHANDPDADKYRLCQGTPLGKGPIEGERFGHAWVEKTEALPIPDDADPQIKELFGNWKLVTVYDYSNGNSFEGPAELYYAIGQIVQGEPRQYTHDEMDEWILKTGKSGPWEDSPIYGPINENSVYEAGREP